MGLEPGDVLLLRDFEGDPTAWVYQLEAWCIERRRLERFNAACLLNAERWRRLA